MPLRLGLEAMHTGVTKRPPCDLVNASMPRASRGIDADNP